MRHVVRFHPAARDETSEIAGFLAKEASPAVPMSWLASLEHEIDGLATMPKRHPRAREADLFPGIDLRQVLVGPYRVIFKVGSRTVDVLHIRHAARLGLDPSAGDPPDSSP